MREAGDFWKRREAESSTVVAGGLFGIRLDGRAFSTFTRNFAKPFDVDVTAAMDAGLLAVLHSVFPMALCGFTQSDEATVIIGADRELPFGGKVEKMLTIAASTMSVAFAASIRHRTDDLPVFDARIFAISDLAEAHDNITWRRMDARRNAVSMAASALFDHRDLLGQTTAERARMLEGTEFEVLDEGLFNGRLVVRREVTEEVTFVAHGTESTAVVTRRPWVVEPATRDAVAEVFEG